MHFIDGLLEKMPVSEKDIHAGILGYSTNVSEHAGLVSEKSTVLSARENLKLLGGRTFTDQAVSAAAAVLSSDKRAVPKVMIVLTDGPAADRPAAEKAYLAAKAAGISVLTVLIGEANSFPPPASWSAVPSIEVFREPS